MVELWATAVITYVGVGVALEYETTNEDGALSRTVCGMVM